MAHVNESGLDIGHRTTRNMQHMAAWWAQVSELGTQRWRVAECLFVWLAA